MKALVEWLSHGLLCHILALTAKVRQTTYAAKATMQGLWPIAGKTGGQGSLCQSECDNPSCILTFSGFHGS